MDINWIEHQDIDPKKWDACIANACNGTIFASFDFLSISNPFSALVYGDYETVMPLATRQKYGISYIFHPFFITRMGIFSQKPIETGRFLHFLDKIPSKFKKIEICFENNIPYEKISNPHSNQLDLNQNYNDIYKDYSENTKRNLKSGVKQGLIYRNEGNINAIIALFAQNMGKNEYIPFKNSDYETLARLAAYAMENNCLEVASVENNDGKLVAGGLFIKDYDRSWFWFSGRNEQLSEGKPMFFLIDKWIKQHAETATKLDFNGSQNSNIDRFYKSFGAKEYPYSFLQISNSKIINTIQRWVKR